MEGAGDITRCYNIITQISGQKVERCWCFIFFFINKGIFESFLSNGAAIADAKSNCKLLNDRAKVQQCSLFMNAGDIGMIKQAQKT